LVRELELFSSALVQKPRILIGTKMDLPEAQEHFEAFRAAYPQEQVYGISTITGQGLDALRFVFRDKVRAYEALEHEQAAQSEALFDEIVFQDEEPFV